MNKIVKQIDTLTPANFPNLAPGLQKTLAFFRESWDGLPDEFIFSNNPSGKNFLANTQRILLLMGPGIGIGDEIMFFRMPQWIEKILPQAEITVLSAYPDLWDNVKGIDSTVYYNDYIPIMNAIRGKKPFEKFDIVVLADFEKADLVKTICFEPGVDRYIEISSGIQSAAAVDNRNRLLHRTQLQNPWLSNYYSGVDELAHWLGIPPDPAIHISSALRHNIDRANDILRIFVNPFTSKYDPSEPYWSHLLASLASSRLSRPVGIVLDPGPNLVTERFTYALQRSVKARVPAGVEVEIAHSEGARTLALGDVFKEMEKSHAVICADSFAAHAAPLFDCITLVVAHPDLVNWRVPFHSSYYFNTEESLQNVTDGMREVLKCIDSGNPGSEIQLPLSEPGTNLYEIEKKLRHSIDSNHDTNCETLYNIYEEYILEYIKTIGSLDKFPPGFAGLFSDSSYNRVIEKLNRESFESIEFTDLLDHLRGMLDRWQNTNLRKYLGMILKHGK